VKEGKCGRKEEETAPMLGKGTDLKPEPPLLVRSIRNVTRGGKSIGVVEEFFPQSSQLSK